MATKKTTKRTAKTSKETPAEKKARMVEVLDQIDVSLNEMSFGAARLLKDGATTTDLESLAAAIQEMQRNVKALREYIAS